MDARELRRSFWTDAAKGGGVLGLVWVICALVGLQITSGWVASLISLLAFVALGYFIFYFTRQRSLKYGDKGFSYGQGVGYIFSMMLFAGFIVGAGEFIAIEFIAPEYYEELGREVLDNTPTYNPDSLEGEMMESMIGSALFWAFVAAIRIIFIGGLIGLFTSAFLKRKPDIFAEDNTVNE